MARFYDFNNNEFDNINRNSSDESNAEYSKNQNIDSQEVYNDNQEVVSAESSYEWNSGADNNSTEYHYSYVNGNNVDAPHNPNNYDNAYSSTDYTSSDSSQDNTSQYRSYNAGYGANESYNAYQGNVNSGYDNAHSSSAGQPKSKKPKKHKKPASKGFVAAMAALAVVVSGAAGFGGGYIANNLNSNSGAVNISQVSSSSTTSTSTSSSASTTSAVVKEVADSVVEIATESVVTGNFAQQYVQNGAGSGVIISEDGYIITNYHVIDGASTITVTLRDGTTNYTAKLIGGDEDQDIALLKIDATGLTAATFGDSSSLSVGDYVIAIGNPLGELGGTVTDGIISALAREVTIENTNMTLLQTNAQISPGNSGGGLFNANGELIGITNAKDSATEVEGISFAIPINNVLDIINDLKSYGYVTGKIDLGMQLTDVTSSSAYFYGVSQTGCYVSSVTKGSNAEEAGFQSGDLITKVNDTEVSSTSDVDKALEDSKVGDSVKLTVVRNNRTAELTLTLAEYTPSSNSNATNSSGNADNSEQKDIWSQMFGW